MRLFKRSNWHDWVFTIGGIFLSVSLVPGIWGAVTTPVWTAAFAFCVLIAFTYNYFSMKLYLSAGCCFAQVLLWLTILLHAL